MQENNQQASAPWTALALSFVATLAIFIPYVGYTTQVKAIMLDLHMDYTMMGALDSIAALSGGICVYFSGLLINRFGAKAVCVAGLLLSTVGQCAFALAPTAATLMTVRALQGAIIPLLFVGPYNVAMKWGEASNRIGVFMGVMLATDGVGSALAAYSYSHLLTTYGWRRGSLWGALILGVTALLLLAVLRESRSDTGGPTSARPISIGREYLSVLLDRGVIVASLFLVGAGGTYCVSIYWVPTLLIEAGWSEDTAGLVGALFPLAGVVSAVTFGILSDRMGHRRPLIFVAGIGTSASLAVAAYAVSVGNLSLLAVALPCAGLFAYGGVPLGYCLAADSVGIDRAALATGCIMGTGFLLGGMAYPFVLGYIRNVTGLYTVGFCMAAVSLVVFNVLPVMFVSETRKAAVPA